MRAMDALTQNLIDSLTQILSKESVEVSLATLQVCAPILIEHLQMVKKSAVDRRDVETQMRRALDNWLREHPQPDLARQALLEVLEQELLGKPVSGVVPGAQGGVSA